MSWVSFHPLTRITIVVAAILVGAMLTGVERVGEALASISPRGSFDERCEKLPPGSVVVKFSPFSVSENQLFPASTLTRMSENPSPLQRTIGLTRATLGHRSEFNVQGLEDRVGHRACVRPRIHVELLVREVTVYVAQEYASDPCRARTIREHEQQHVDVYAAYAAEAVGHLQDRLHAVIGAAPVFATTVGEAQQRLDRRIEQSLEAFMRESEATLAARQARIDTPEEYARVTNACNVASGN